MSPCYDGTEKQFLNLTRDYLDKKKMVKSTKNFMGGEPIKRIIPS